MCACMCIRDLERFERAQRLRPASGDDRADVAAALLHEPRGGDDDVVAWRCVYVHTHEPRGGDDDAVAWSHWAMWMGEWVGG